METVTIQFEDNVLAAAFMAWFMEQGEQDMWEWDGLSNTSVDYDTRKNTIMIDHCHPDGYSH